MKRDQDTSTDDADAPLGTGGRLARPGARAGVEPRAFPSDSAPVGCLSLDARGLITQVNVAAARLLGRERSDLPGQSLAALLDRPSRALLDHCLAQWRQGEPDLPCRVSPAAKRDAPRPSLLEITPLAWAAVDQDQPPETLRHLLITDIGERRRMEEALEASENKFRALFEQAAVGVAQIRSDNGRIIGINQKFCKMLGYGREEMLGRSFLDITHPDDRQASQEGLDRLLKGDLGEFSLEKRYIRKDGSPVWVTLTVSPLWREGEPPDFHLAVVVDISNHVRDRQALAAGAKVDAALAELAKALMSLSSAEEIVGRVYATAKQLTDSPTGFVGQIDQASGHLVSSSPSLGMWGYCRVPNKSKRFSEFRGLWGWVLRNRQPLMTNDPTKDPRYRGVPQGHIPIRRFLSAPAMFTDALLGVVAVANAERDYTDLDLDTIRRLGIILALALERHDYEEELVSHREKLRSLASQLSEAEEAERLRLASDLHDSVGQNLGMASQRLKMLRASQMSRPEDLDSVIGLIDQAIASTRSLTAELSPPVLSLMGLGPALEWLAETQTARHNMGIVFKDDGEPKPLGQQESAFLFRAAAELVANAIKHARATGIVISLARKGGQVELTVADNGHGFSYQHVNRHKSEGFGLFSISERLHCLGGDLSVNSQSGQGAMARLRLPLDKPRKAGTP